MRTRPPSKKARVVCLPAIAIFSVAPVFLLCLRPSKIPCMCLSASDLVNRFHFVSRNNVILWFVNREFVRFMMIFLRRVPAQ
jgi:hypothetical protein